jgi:hypothetical protein
VPVVAEKYTISKKVTTQDFIIERERWGTGTAKIRAASKLLRIYVNGNNFGSKDRLESISISSAK